MKKSILNLEGVVLLSKKEQKTIFGGSRVFESLDNPTSGGSCCVRYYTSGGLNGDGLVKHVACDVSKEDAISLSSTGGNWCCKSCDTASWTVIG